MFININTPAGWVKVLSGEKGIKKISFTHSENSPSLTESPQKQQGGVIFNRARRWFEDDYWGKTGKPFPWDLIDCYGSTPFQQKVLKLLWQIPYGEVATYKEIAKKMGLTGGAQAIGQANKKNPVPIIIPCHRVIASDGSLGGYAPGIFYKKKLLEHEGVLRERELLFSPSLDGRGQGEGDRAFMRQALNEAKKAAGQGEIPIGALLVREGKIISRGFNRRQKTKNPLNHAEMIALEKGAKKIGDWRLADTTLYVTLEPCPMCLGALLQARVKRLVFGCADPKRSVGAGLRPAPTLTTYSFPSMGKMCRVAGNNHTLDLRGGVLAEECGGLLKDFFKVCRQ